MEFLGLSLDQWLDALIALIMIVLAIPVGFWLVDLLERRVGRWMSARTLTTFDDRLLDAAHRPARWLLVTLVAEIAVSRLDFLSLEAQRVLGDLFFLVYLFLGLWFSWRLISSLFAWYGREIAARTQTDLDEHLLPFFRRVGLVIVSLLALSILLSHYEVDVTGLVTTLGIGSLAIALAAQAALEDTISGFLIMVDRPFRIGDRIELLDLQTWGDVIDIGLRSSRICTRDNRMVVVPNSVIGRSLIVNHSYPNETYRIHVNVGVAYGSDLDHVRQVLIDAVRGVEGVLSDHLVEALFLEFGDSALVFRVRWWINSYNNTRPMYDRVNTAIYKALNAAGISIPFPQRDVHHKVDAGTLRRTAGFGDD